MRVTSHPNNNQLFRPQLFCKREKRLFRKHIFIAMMEVCPSWNSNVISMDKLTDLQTRTLERIFEVCQRPSGYAISVIARQMELSEVSVKNYFDNAAHVKKAAAASTSTAFV